MLDTHFEICANSVIRRGGMGEICVRGMLDARTKKFVAPVSRVSYWHSGSCPNRLPAWGH